MTDMSSSTVSTVDSTTISSSKKKNVECTLDPSLVNADTFPLMKDPALSIFPSACSKNRGAFVLSPPDGHTYGCLAFPEDILKLAGTESADFKVTNVEAIIKHSKNGTLTSADAVKLLDFLVTNVYQSTPNVAFTPYACDTSGLVTLKCNPTTTTSSKTPIRAVTMAGAFTPTLWATAGQELTLEQASSFYTSDDFEAMKKLGLNTVQIPIPTKMFSQEHVVKAAPWKNLLLTTLQDIQAADLKVILLLSQADSPSKAIAEPVKEAALFAQDYNANHEDTIIALILPALDKALLEAATIAAPDLNVWIPTKGGDFKDLHNYPQAAAASLELSHTSTVGDIASSTSQEDRSKLFYHESMSCIYRAPLEYSTCYQDMTVMVTSGFDLAIDDCHLQNSKNYGQCNRFDETVDSPWWKEHRFSLAARQLFAYEKGRGWSFAAWKLYKSNDPKSSLGVIDAPAKLLAFQEVVAAGLMPSLLDLDQPSSPVGLACLNPPVNDFILGDATLAPTPAPPPDCGNGWWNFDTKQCDYWVPPTTPPCPICPNDKVLITEPITVDRLQMVHANVDGSLNPAAPNDRVAAKAFVLGALLSALVCVAIFKSIMGANRRRGYEPVASDHHYQGNKV